MFLIASINEANLSASSQRNPQPAFYSTVTIRPGFSTLMDEKDGIRHVQRAVVECVNSRNSPADFGDRTFDISVRRTNPVSDTEGAIEIEHNTEKMLRTSFARHTNSDTADTAKVSSRPTDYKMFSIQ